MGNYVQKSLAAIEQHHKYFGCVTEHHPPLFMPRSWAELKQLELQSLYLVHYRSLYILASGTTLKYLKMFVLI